MITRINGKYKKIVVYENNKYILIELNNYFLFVNHVILKLP